MGIVREMPNNGTIGIREFGGTRNGPEDQNRLTYTCRGCRTFQAIVMALCAPLAACQHGDLPPDVSRESPVIPLDTGYVRIETADEVFELSVEIAESPEQKSIGLMGRTFLPEDEGMLFVYPEEQPGSAPFYMFRTLIPLDIAFFDSEGMIVSILQMEPCEKPVAAWCERYPPGVPYHGALEANQGLFASKGIGVGDRIVLNEGR